MPFYHLSVLNLSSLTPKAIAQTFHRAYFRKILFNIWLLMVAAAFMRPSPAIAKEALPRIKEKWPTITYPNFTLYSQADEKTTVQMAKYFAYLHHGLFIMAGRTAPEAAMPMNIYLFQNKKSYLAFKPKDGQINEGSQAFWLQQPDGNYLALNATAPSSDDGAQLYSQYLLRTHFINLPLWLERGFAAYFRTFKLNAKEVTIGLPLMTYLTTLRDAEGMPYEQLLNLTEAALPTLDKKSAHQWPAQSWLLVHYLFHGRNDTLRLKMETFLKALEEGTSSEAALEKVLGLKSQTLSSDLQRYARQLQHGFLTIALTQLRPLAAIRVEFLTEEQILYHLGDLLAHQGDQRLHEAEAYFKAALTLHPGFAPAYSGWGYAAAQKNQTQAANDYFTKALAENTADAVTFFRYASFLLDTVDVVPTAMANERILQARGYLQRAIDLNDGLTEAYILYGHTFLSDLRGSRHSGITALEKALTRMPNRDDAAIDLLCLYVLDGDTLRANYYLEEVFPKRWGEEVQSRTRQKMIEAHLAVAQIKMGEGKYAAVIDRLRHAYRHVSLPKQRERVQTLLTTAKEKRQAELYHWATARAQSGEDATAVDHLQEAIALNADGRVTASCRTLYAQVSKRLQRSLYSDAMMKMNENKLKQAESLLLRAIALDANPEITSRAKQLLKSVRAAL